MSIFAIRKIISHMSIVKYGEKTDAIQCATIKRLKRNIDGRMKIGGTKIFTSRVWGRHAPARALRKRGSVAEVQSRRGTIFSGIENLWPRDGSCSLRFHILLKGGLAMDIEVKQMSTDTIELLDHLNVVCKRFHVDYPHASEKDKFFVEAVALHEYQLKKAHEQGLKRADVPPFLGLKRTERSNEMPA